MLGSFHTAGAINFSFIGMNSDSLYTDLDQCSVWGSAEEIKSDDRNMD